MISIKTAQNIKDGFTNKLVSIKIIDTDDNIHFIPFDESNIDYQYILEWEKIDGNTIQEAD